MSILSKIASGANRFGEELLNPTNALGKFGAYLGAVSGGDLGRATLASMRDRQDSGDLELDRQIKQLRLQQMQQPPQQAPTEFERMLQASGVQPGSPQWASAMQQAVASRIDPEIIVPLPGKSTYVGPRSRLSEAMGAGVAPPVPGGMAPTPPNQGPSNFADINGAGQMIQSMGAQGFLGWQKKHGTPVLVNSPEEMAALPPGTRVVSPDGREGVKQ